MRELSYFHRGSTEPLRGETIPEWFAQVVSSNQSREAVVSKQQSRRLTYGVLADEVDCLARGLLGLGFQKGDHIGIWSTSNIEWLLLQMATARAGMVLVNINPAYRSNELAYAILQSQIAGLILIPGFRKNNYLETVQGLIPELKEVPNQRLKNERFPSLRQVIVYDPISPTSTKRPAAGFLVWKDLIAASGSVSKAFLNSVTSSLDRDESVNIQYTSGTTGSPKAVVLTHHNLLNNAWFAAKSMHFNAEDRLCVAVPFYHCFGMVLSNLLCLSVGGCLVIPAEHFDPLMVLQAIAEERCTAIHGVPTMFIAELEHPQFRDFDLTSLRTGIMAGAPCAPELLRQVMKDMHCSEMLIGYGQTEASPLTHLTSRDDTLRHRLETVGSNLPHQEVKVVSTETGATVPLGQVGEVCFRGYHVMHGYYGDTEASNETLDASGWLHSGDLGIMEPGGYLQITGRLKEMILRGGENIYPQEIEDFLFTHSKVASVAVFGIPDERFGEAVIAWIKLHENEVATEDEIREYCTGQIAHFKIPKQIWFVDKFPMTVTGKIQKYRMREMVLDELNTSA